MINFVREIEQINRDLKKCEQDLAKAKTTEELVHYTTLKWELENEKREYWNTLYEGHRNWRI